MFQQFNTDTLGSRFIKSLLSQTPVPLFTCVVDGDYLVEGCYYVYKNFIIKCHTGGVLRVSESEALKPSEMLYPRDDLFPAIYLYPESGYRFATFHVLSYIDSNDRFNFNTFDSSVSHYDSDTHIQLGKYLRYLQSTSGPDLMNYYNCYSGITFGDVELKTAHEFQFEHVTVQRVSQQRYKVIAVPILFGKTYSIFLDCPSEVLVRACLYDKTGLIDSSVSFAETSNDIKTPIVTDALDTALKNSGRIYTHMRFKTPETFRIEIDELSSMLLQKYLYLLIQVPLSNNSSIVVLENFDDSTGIACDENHVRKYITKPYLTKMNTYCSYAFSDRLVEYLLGNIISSQDSNRKNIEKVQDALSQTNPSYKIKLIKNPKQKGYWDSSISSLLFNIAETELRDNCYDQDGFVNKDMEQIIKKKGLLY